MTVDSYLELFTTLFGWVFVADGVPEVQKASLEPGVKDDFHDIKFDPICSFIVSANKMPKANESSYGYLRRLLQAVTGNGQGNQFETPVQGAPTQVVGSQRREGRGQLAREAPLRGRHGLTRPTARPRPSWARGRRSPAPGAHPTGSSAPRGDPTR